MSNDINKYVERVADLLEIFEVSKEDFHFGVPDCSKQEFNLAMRGKGEFRIVSRIAVVNLLRDYADQLFFKGFQVKQLALEKQKGFTKSALFNQNDWKFVPEEISNPRAIAIAINDQATEVYKLVLGGLKKRPSAEGENLRLLSLDDPELATKAATELNKLVSAPVLIRDSIPSELHLRRLTLLLARKKEEGASVARVNRRVIEDIFPGLVRQRHFYDFDSQGLLDDYPHKHLLEENIDAFISKLSGSSKGVRIRFGTRQSTRSLSRSQIVEMISLALSMDTSSNLSVEEGSTEYVLVVDSVAAEKIVSWLRKHGAEHGGLSLISVEEVEEIGAPPRDEPVLVIERGQQPAESAVDQFLSDVGRRYEPKSIVARFLESARLLWTVIMLGKAGLTIAVSRFYISPGLLANSFGELFGSKERKFTVSREALSYAFVYWPILTFFLTFIPAYVLTCQSGPMIALTSALFATVMGLVGGLVCGPLFPVLGVGAGGAGFGVMYGITQAVLALHVAANMNPAPTALGMSLFAQISLDTDPFVATVLGAIGTSAHFISLSMLPFFLFLPSCAINLSAWLMGNPRATDDNVTPPFRKKWSDFLSRHAGLEKGSPAMVVALGAFVGISGVGIVKGLYVGLTTLAHLDKSAGEKNAVFWSLVMLVGGACYTMCVWLRTNDWSRARKWGIGYAITAGVFGILIWLTRGHAASFFFTELATAFFHACFFTLSYAVGFALLERRAAFLAAAIEGTLGFVLFNVINFFQSHSVAPVPANFPYSWITVLLIGVTTFWITMALYHVISLRVAAIRSVSSWLIPCVFFSYLLLLCFLPKQPQEIPGVVNPDIPWPIVRSVHYGGIAVLFGFLIFGAICQCQVWHIFRRAGPNALSLLADVYKKWWAATRLLPAPAAFCILLSGLRLIYEDSGRGFLALGWLFWLVAGFSFFFFDGLMFYLPEICAQFKAVEAAKEAGQTIQDFAVERRRPFHEAMLFFHSLCFPLVFFVGCFKPALPYPHDFVQCLQTAGDAISAKPDNARCWSAAILVAIIGVAWLVLRLGGLLKYFRYLFGKGE